MMLNVVFRKRVQVREGLMAVITSELSVHRIFSPLSFPVLRLSVRFQGLTWVKAFFAGWTNKLVMLSHMFEVRFLVVVSNLTWLTEMSIIFFVWMSFLLFLPFNFLRYFFFFWPMWFNMIFIRKLPLESSVTVLKRTSPNYWDIFCRILLLLDSKLLNSTFCGGKYFRHNFWFLDSLWFGLTTWLTNK